MSAETMEAQETQSKADQEVVALSVTGQGQKTSTLKLSTKYSELPGKRPIEASNMTVVSTFGASRPVLASEFEVSGTLTVSGKRPIAVSHLNVSQSYTVMGNRPVASNEIDDSSILMGYLD